MRPNYFAISFIGGKGDYKLSTLPNRAARGLIPKAMLLSTLRALAIVYFFGIVLSQLDHSHYYLAAPLAFGSCLITFLVLEHFRYDLRSSAVLLLVICQLYFFGRIDFVSRPWGWYYILGHAAYLVFMLGLWIGIKIFGSKVRGTRVNFESHEKTRHLSRPSRLYFAGIITLVMYALGLNYLLTATGATGTFVELIFQSLATRLAVAEYGLSPLLQLMYVLGTIGLGCGFILWRDYKHRFLIIAWILQLGYSALVLGSRGAIVLPLLQLLLASSLLLRRPLALLAVLAVPLIIAINIFSTWYLAAREGAEALSDENYSILNRFDAYENWLRFSTAKGIELNPGASIPSVFLQFVPRRIYEEKPYYFSTEMTRINVPDAFDLGVNLDFGGIAESIYNFGPLGPPMFGIFLGWVACRLDHFKELARQKRDPLFAYIFAQGALIPASFFFVGWINTALIFGVIGFLILFKIFKLIAVPRRQNAAIHNH